MKQHDESNDVKRILPDDSVLVTAGAPASGVAIADDNLRAVLESESRVAIKTGLLHGLVDTAGTVETLEILWAGGNASVTPRRKPMRTDAIFDLASVTKVVATASACAICIDRGLLDPDAPAIEYLPQLAQFSGSIIRVRDLATHCSGYDSRHYNLERNFDDVIEMPAQWPARQRFEYSCRNFIVLGRIVERVTGENLASFCEKNVFAPLGMTHTTFGPIRSDLGLVVPTQQSAGTISDNQARKAGRPIGNAGLFSTATDLALFCQMLLSGGKTKQKRIILNTKGLDWLMHPCNLPHFPRRSFGWDMRPCSECLHRPLGLSELAIGHSGWTGNSVWVDPKFGLYVIVLSNRAHQSMGDNFNESCRFRTKIADIIILHVKEHALSKQN